MWIVWEREEFSNLASPGSIIFNSLFFGFSYWQRQDLHPGPSLLRLVLLRASVASNHSRTSRDSVSPEGTRALSRWDMGGHVKQGHHAEGNVCVVDDSQAARSTVPVCSSHLCPILHTSSSYFPFLWLLFFFKASLSWRTEEHKKSRSAGRYCLFTQYPRCASR